MKPFLKWVGGKQKILNKIYDHFPETFKNYFEPFAGGAAVFFGLSHNQDKNFYVSDLNEKLIFCYNFIKQSDDSEFYLFLDHLEALFYNHCKKFYYAIRDDKRNYEISHRAVAKFIYLNKHCFNGLYRVNQEGEFNVPCGSEKKINIENQLQHLCLVRKYLQNVNVFFSCQSYEKINPQQGDFVYLDPPYFHCFNAYTKETFDQQKLKSFCDALTYQGVFFLLSNLSCEDCEELYKDYFIENLSVQSNMGRKTQHELLIKNYYFDSKIFVP